MRNSKKIFFYLIIFMAVFRVPSQYWFIILSEKVFGFHPPITAIVIFSTPFFVFLYKKRMSKFEQDARNFIFALFILLLFSVVLSEDIVISLVFLGKYLGHYLLFLLIVFLLSSEQIDELLKLYFLFSFVFVVTAFFLFHIYGNNISYKTATTTVNLSTSVVKNFGKNFARVTMPGMDKNRFTILISVSILIGLYLLKIKKQKMYLLLLLPQFYFVLQSFSKQSLLVVLIGILLMVYSRWYKYSLITFYFLIGLTTVIFFNLEIYFIRLVFILKYIPFINFDTSKFERVYWIYDSSNRLDRINSTLPFFIKHPIWGTGPGYLMEKQSQMLGYSEHNFFLKMFAEHGSIWGILFLILIIFSFRKISSGINYYNSYAEKLKKELIKFLFITTSLTLFVAPVDYLFWFILGIVFVEFGQLKNEC